MMNEVGVVKAKKQPLLPRWLKFLLILVGTLLFLAASAWVLLDIVTRQDLRAALAEVEALGWPLTPEELYPEPIPDSENAALVYDQAWVLDQPQTEVVSRVEDVEAWRALTEAEQTHVREALANVAQVLALLHQAAQMERCQFDLRYSDGYAMLLPHLSKMRNCVRWERVASIVALVDGRTDEALEHWLDSVAMVRHQEGQKVLISELVRSACLSISLDVFGSIVQERRLSESELTRALAALEGIELRQGFVAALKSELCFVMGLANRPAKEIGNEISDRSWPPELPFLKVYCSPLGRPWRNQDQASFLLLSKDAVRAGEQPYYQARLRPGSARQMRQMDDLSWLQAPLNTMVLSELIRALEALARAEARVLVSRTALALERYRLTHGEYPRALTDLAPDLLPEVPLDPFDGKPLRYIKSPERVAVYSVGPDLQDDGGSEEEKPYPRRGVKDIVFTVRRAPEQGGEEGPPP